MRSENPDDFIDIKLNDILNHACVKRNFKNTKTLNVYENHFGGVYQ